MIQYSNCFPNHMRVQEMPALIKKHIVQIHTCITQKLGDGTIWSPIVSIKYEPPDWNGRCLLPCCVLKALRAAFQNVFVPRDQNWTMDTMPQTMTDKLFWNTTCHWATIIDHQLIFAQSFLVFSVSFLFGCLPSVSSHNTLERKQHSLKHGLGQSFGSASIYHRQHMKSHNWSMNSSTRFPFFYSIHGVSQKQYYYQSPACFLVLCSIITDQSVLGLAVENQ